MHTDNLSPFSEVLGGWTGELVSLWVTGSLTVAVGGGELCVCVCVCVCVCEVRSQPVVLSPPLPNDKGVCLFFLHSEVLKCLGAFVTQPQRGRGAEFNCLISSVT